MLCLVYITGGAFDLYGFHSTNTVFMRMIAAATIIFSLAGVRLLIEGGSYLRTAFIYFGAIPLGV
jgi:hypothetical protein